MEATQKQQTRLILANRELILTPGKSYGIGKKNGNPDFFITFPDESLDDKHAIVEVDHADKLLLMDLYSVNGTFINERRLIPFSKIQLTHGMDIRLGNLNGTFLVGDAQLGQQQHDSSGFNNSDIFSSSLDSSLNVITSPVIEQTSLSLVRKERANEMEQMYALMAAANEHVPDTQFQNGNEILPAHVYNDADNNDIQLADDEIFIPETQEVMSRVPALNDVALPIFQFVAPTANTGPKSVAAEDVLNDIDMASQIRLCTQDFREHTMLDQNIQNDSDNDDPEIIKINWSNPRADNVEQVNNLQTPDIFKLEEMDEIEIRAAITENNKLSDNVLGRELKATAPNVSEHSSSGIDISMMATKEDENSDSDTLPEVQNILNELKKDTDMRLIASSNANSSSNAKQSTGPLATTYADATNVDVHDLMPTQFFAGSIPQHVAAFDANAERKRKLADPETESDASTGSSVSRESHPATSKMPALRLNEPNIDDENANLEPTQLFTALSPVHLKCAMNSNSTPVRAPAAAADEAVPNVRTFFRSIETTPSPKIDIDFGTIATPEATRRAFDRTGEKLPEPKVQKESATAKKKKNEETNKEKVTDKEKTKGKEKDKKKGKDKDKQTNKEKAKDTKKTRGKGKARAKDKDKTKDKGKDDEIADLETSSASSLCSTALDQWIKDGYQHICRDFHALFRKNQRRPLSPDPDAVSLKYIEYPKEENEDAATTGNEVDKIVQDSDSAAADNELNSGASIVVNSENSAALSTGQPESNDNKVGDEAAPSDKAEVKQRISKRQRGERKVAETAVDSAADAGKARRPHKVHRELDDERKRAAAIENKNKKTARVLVAVNAVGNEGETIKKRLRKHPIENDKEKIKESNGDGAADASSSSAAGVATAPPKNSKKRDIHTDESVAPPSEHARALAKEPIEAPVETSNKTGRGRGRGRGRPSTSDKNATAGESKPTAAADSVRYTRSYSHQYGDLEENNNLKPTSLSVSGTKAIELNKSNDADVSAANRKHDDSTAASSNKSNARRTRASAAAVEPEEPSANKKLAQKRKLPKSSDEPEPVVAVKQLRSQHEVRNAEVKEAAQTPVAVADAKSASGAMSTASTTKTPKLLIMTSMVSEERLGELQATKTSNLWCFTKDVVEADILLMDQSNRTFKFLVAIARGIPIVRTEWLIEFNKTQKVNNAKYLFFDAKFERRYGFKLLESYQLARKQKLFTNIKFMLTHNIAPQPAEIKTIIECAGGTVLNEIPSKDDFFLVSSRADNRYWHKYRRTNKNVRVISTESIMSAVMKQKVEALLEHAL